MPMSPRLLRPLVRAIAVLGGFLATLAGFRLVTISGDPIRTIQDG
jgi:hypothetical protein